MLVSVTRAPPLQAEQSVNATPRKGPPGLAEQSTVWFCCRGPKHAWSPPLLRDDTVPRESRWRLDARASGRGTARAGEGEVEVVATAEFATSGGCPGPPAWTLKTGCLLALCQVQRHGSLRLLVSGGIPPPR